MRNEKEHNKLSYSARMPPVAVQLYTYQLSSLGVDVSVVQIINVVGIGQVFIKQKFPIRQEYPV